jgi:triosephosphate isomerase
MNRKSIVAANWKMNGNLALVKSISSQLNALNVSTNVDIVVCPSFLYIAELQKTLTAEQVYVGAQNISEHESGAFTGETSGAMLNEFNVTYVIVGHSERRTLYKETSTHVAEKVKAALAHNLTPILCIGESEAERVAEHTETVLAAQIQPVIDMIGIENFEHVVIAYEPIWAIGTGKTASPAIAQQTHAFIRKFIAKYSSTIAEKIPLLYGGSVNAGNCDELFAQSDIDGGLIGGASLKADEFLTICSAAKGH